MSSRVRNFCVNIVLVIFSCIVALALLEACVRLFTKPVYPILRTDALVGTIHEKNVDRMVWNDEADAKTHILTNSLGYIGRDYPLQKSSGTLRVAFLGDSMTEGLQVNHDEHFLVLLERALNATASSTAIEVMNYGVGGTGTFLQYQTYKQNIVPYRPDVTVLMFHSNDFSDNMNKSQFDPEKYASAEGRRPWLKSFLLKFQLPKFIFTRFQTNVPFLEFLNTIGLYEFNEYTRRAIAPNSTPIANDPNYYELTFNLIKRLDRHIDADGGELIVIAMPDEPEYGKWGDVEQNKKLAELLHENGIKFFDPSPMLEKAKMETGECLTFSCAGHMNSRGHKVMAEILRNYFQDNNIMYP